MHSEPYTEPWINTEGWGELDISSLTTPCYVVSERHLEHNLRILQGVMERTRPPHNGEFGQAGCRILMAMKCYSMFPTFPLIAQYLPGSEASSIHEARLGFEEFGPAHINGIRSGEPEVHTFSPSYTEGNIQEYIKYSSHLSFNSFSQWKKFKATIAKSPKKVSCGIRVNPEHR